MSLRIAVLISGGGSTLANLLERIGDGRLRGVEIVGVVSSRRQVRGVELARTAGLPVEIVRLRDFPTPEHFAQRLSAVLDAWAVELVAMAGFLCFWQIPPRYLGRVVNIHPALLPEFGGKGMHGLHVHAAVLADGRTESGCTVHIADNQYDHGPIVAQRRVTVHADDTPETLAARVQQAEQELYPEVIQTVAERGIRWLQERFSAASR